MSHPTEFFVRLQHGITGGFAPPQPTAIYTVSASPQIPQVFLVQSINPRNPSAQSVEPKKLNVKDNHTKLVSELHGILKDLPIESPPGSEDIYHMDTGIAWGSADLEWANGGPQGCTGGSSSTQATDEQHEKFKRAVAIITELTNE